MKPETKANLRGDIETFLFWYAAVFIVSSFITGIGIPFAMREMVLNGGSSESTTVLFLSGLGSYLTGFVGAIWLWRRHHPIRKSQIIWALFGLAAPLWAVGMYLLLMVILPAELALDDGENEQNTSK